MTPRLENREESVQSAAKSGEIVSDLLNPGETDTQTMLDLCSFAFTTGTMFSSAFGVCDPCGSESRMRCRWRVKTIICSERCPSCKKIDLLLPEGSEVGENEVTAAA